MNNLPPGVTVSDLPGNRPEDQRLEALEERFWVALGATDDKPLGIDDTIVVTTEVIERLVGLAAEEFRDGFETAQADAAAFYEGYDMPIIAAAQEVAATFNSQQITTFLNAMERLSKALENRP